MGNCSRLGVYIFSEQEIGGEFREMTMNRNLSYEVYVVKGVEEAKGTSENVWFFCMEKGRNKVIVLAKWVSCAATPYDPFAFHVHVHFLACHI